MGISKLLIHTRELLGLGITLTKKFFCLFKKTKQKHQEKYNANSVIPHNVLASDYLTDCHQALFFQQDTLVY